MTFDLHLWGRALCAATVVLLLAAPAAADEADPWRGMNEGTHGFNEALDQTVVEPVGRGWDFAVPDLVQDAVGNFFENLRVPRTILNDFLQAEVDSGARHFGRFLVNTTVGLGGLIDVAGATGIEHDPEDFGQTLGVWGVGPGPYLVLPLLGPSTVRDTVALPVDYATNPAFWVGEAAVTVTATVVDTANRRAGALEEISDNRETAVDYYVFLRDAYLQNRARNVADGAVTQDEDLYDLDDLE